MAVTFQKCDNIYTSTEIKMSECQSLLPDGLSRAYLGDKATWAMKIPKIGYRINKKTGDKITVKLRQQTFTQLIRLDERSNDYLWPYKAEVSFNIRKIPPMPYLTKSSQDFNRRHTLNPFPVLGAGIYRRPDLIIVKDRYTRWPGLAGLDEQLKPHPDNLLRLVEVKFPDDTLGDDQYNDYMLIVAGDTEKMTVLDIEEGEGGEPKGRRVPNTLNSLDKLFFWLLPPLILPIWWGGGGRGPFPPPVPIGSPPGIRPTLVPTPEEQSLLEQMVLNLRGIAGLIPEELVDDVKALRDEAVDGVMTVRNEVVDHVADHIPEAVVDAFNYTVDELIVLSLRGAEWFGDAGEWVYDTTAEALTWVDEQGRRIVSWSAQQIRDAWSAIQEATDITIDFLKGIDWAQIAIVTAAVVTVIVVGVAVYFLGIPAAIVGAFMLIVEVAVSSWQMLLLLLGISGGTAILATP